MVDRPFSVWQNKQGGLAHRLPASPSLVSSLPSAPCRGSALEFLAWTPSSEGGEDVVRLGGACDL